MPQKVDVPNNGWLDSNFLLYD